MPASHRSDELEAKYLDLLARRGLWHSHHKSYNRRRHIMVHASSMMLRKCSLLVAQHHFLLHIVVYELVLILHHDAHIVAWTSFVCRPVWSWRSDQHIDGPCNSQWTTFEYQPQ